MSFALSSLLYTFSSSRHLRMIHLNVTGDFAFNESAYNLGILFSQTFGTAFNTFTLGVIWLYGGADMKSYRMHLILYQLFSTLLDFGMDTMTQAVFFFPVMGGTAQGWLRTIFGFSTFRVWCIMMTFAGFCLHFIIYSPLLYRYQILLPDTHRFKFKSNKNRRIYEAIQLSIATPATFIVTSILYEKQEHAFQQLYDHSMETGHPLDYELTKIDGFYCFNQTKNNAIIIYNVYVLLWIGFLAGSAVYMTIYCRNALNSILCHMSERTKEIHRRFLKNILLQACIPMLLIEIPFIYWVVFTVLELRFSGHQNLTNLTVWCLSVHGAFGSCIVFYLNPCYRRLVYNWTVKPLKFLRLQKPDITVSVIGASTMASAGLRPEEPRRRASWV